jgi:hypothetical protein
MNKPIFPNNKSSLAKKILSVTATSVPAESLFSIMGIIVDEQKEIDCYRQL